MGRGAVSWVVWNETTKTWWTGAPGKPLQVYCLFYAALTWERVWCPWALDGGSGAITCPAALFYGDTMSRMWYPLPGFSTNYARFIRTVCMHRIRWSCEGLTSVHNEYTGYLLKHLLLRHMYNLPLPILLCCAQALCSETSYCYRCYWSTAAESHAVSVSFSLTLYCAVLYILLV